MQTIECILNTGLNNIEELLKIWDIKGLPENSFLSRFRIETEYDKKRDLVVFWEEWPHTPVKFPLRSYGIFVKLKNNENPTESTLELWIEKKVSRRNTNHKCVDPAPIDALISALMLKIKNISK